MWNERNPGAGLLGYFAVGITTALLAASAAYVLDPRSGRRRRALIRDQFTRQTHQAQEFFDKATRDARQRARGLYAASRSKLQRESVDNGILEQRVRAHLGRLSSHPSAIEVTCSNGYVRLSGDVLADEKGQVLAGLKKISGVHRVLDEMQTHPDAGTIPGLKGGSERRPSAQFEYLQDTWSPAPRLFAGFAGVAMIAGGAASRSIPGAALAIAGAAMLARSVCNVPLSQFLQQSVQSVQDRLPNREAMDFSGDGRSYEPSALRH
jgi:hypothetical protein